MYLSRAISCLLLLALSGCRSPVAESVVFDSRVGEYRDVGISGIKGTTAKELRRVLNQKLTKYRNRDSLIRVTVGRSESDLSHGLHLGEMPEDSYVGQIWLNSSGATYETVRVGRSVEGPFVAGGSDPLAVPVANGKVRIFSMALRPEAPRRQLATLYLRSEDEPSTELGVQAYESLFEKCDCRNLQLVVRQDEFFAVFDGPTRDFFKLPELGRAPDPGAMTTICLNHGCSTFHPGPNEIRYH